MPNLALLLGAGLAGAYLAARLHLPGGSFIGAMLQLVRLTSMLLLAPVIIAWLFN